VGSVLIVDASPVIVLAKADRLDLITMPEVLLPEQVAEEILAGPADDPARRAVEDGWCARTAPAPLPPRVLEWGLGTGESAVLALALEQPEATVVLDDAEARACARALGLPLIGTLGLVVRAHVEGRIDGAEAIVRDLRAAGLYVAEAVVSAALARLSDA